MHPLGKHITECYEECLKMGIPVPNVCLIGRTQAQKALLASTDCLWRLHRDRFGTVQIVLDGQCLDVSGIAIPV